MSPGLIASLGHSGSQVPQLMQFSVIIIAMTAAAAREDQDACMAAGMDGFISKPFKPDRLLTILESVTVEENRRTGMDHADAPHVRNEAQP